MTDSEQSYINTSDSDDETGTSSSDSAESAASWAGRAKKAARKPNLAQFNTDDEESDSDSDSEQEQVKLKRRVSAGAGTGGSKGVPSLAAKVPVANQAPIERLLERQTKHGQEEFFVKFRDCSYMHCEWVRRSELEVEQTYRGMVTRYMRKEAMGSVSDDPYDPKFARPERVLRVRAWKESTYYLIKWNGRPYIEVTWESEEDIENKADIDKEDFQELVAACKRRNSLPPRVPRRPRPSSAEDGDWVPLKESPSYKNGLTLRSYQIEGLNWLSFCWMEHRNSILADEMGLGKTAQTVSMVNFMHTVYNDPGPFLVVGPLSAVPHFQREFERFTNLNVLLYKDDAKSREVMRELEFRYTDDSGRPITKRDGQEIFKFNVIVTTKEMLRADTNIFAKINWHYVAVDEAHNLKNIESKTTQALTQLKYEHILLLTGTPLQNNIKELWTLLYICDKKRFHDMDGFVEKYSNMDSDTVAHLHEEIRPFMLRRLKEDVELSLKPKEETIINVELTSVQRGVYRAIYEKNGSALVKGGKSNNSFNLRNVVMQLRNCCNHPWTVSGIEDETTFMTQEWLNKLIMASGKMVLLDKLLPHLKAGGHKVIIFSQMVRMLDLIAEYMECKGFSYERLDGRRRGDHRQNAIDRFNAEDECFVFLASTRAGGVGINLTAADTVVIYDSDWNPQNDVQAQARCHRIGQTKDVKIYRLVSRNTYEAEMFDRASKKLGLDRAVLAKLEGSGDKGAKSKETAQQLDKWLRHGAYALFNESDDAAQQFCQEDIENILKNRTSTITEDGTGKKSEFATAAFAVQEDEEELDIEDPNFWAKLGIQEQPEVEIIDQPRQRQQTQRFEQQVFADRAASAAFADSDDDDVDDKDEGSATYRRWRKEDRRAARQGLLRWGWGRWDRIREFKLGHRSELEIEWYARCYLDRCRLAILDVENLGNNSERESWLKWLDEKLDLPFPQVPRRLEGHWPDYDKLVAWARGKGFLPEESMSENSMPTQGPLLDGDTDDEEPAADAAQDEQKPAAGEQPANDEQMDSNGDGPKPLSDKAAETSSVVTKPVAVAEVASTPVSSTSSASADAVIGPVASVKMEAAGGSGDGADVKSDGRQEMSTSGMATSSAETTLVKSEEDRSATKVAMMSDEAGNSTPKEGGISDHNNINGTVKDSPGSARSATKQVDELEKAANDWGICPATNTFGAARIMLAQIKLPRKILPEQTEDRDGLKELMAKCGIDIQACESGLEMEPSDKFNRNIKRELSVLLMLDKARVECEKVLDSPELDRTVIELPFTMPTMQASGAAWWKEIHDKELLWGTYVHGMNRWDDIRNDEKLVNFPIEAVIDDSKDEDRQSLGGITPAAASLAVGRSDTPASAAGDGLSLLRWPSTHVLGQRYKKMMSDQANNKRLRDQMERKLLAESKRQRILSERLAKQKERERIAARKYLEWQIRERWALVRSLMDNGLPCQWNKETQSFEPQWQELYDSCKSALNRKSPKSLEKFYAEFISQLREAAIKALTSSSEGGDKAAGDGAGAADEKEGGTKKEKKSKEEKMQAPTKHANKILSRIQLLSTVRTLVFHPDMNDEKIVERIKSSPFASISLPCGDWKIEHDLALLKAVHKHGLVWDNLRQDPDAPFVTDQDMQRLQSGEVRLEELAAHKVVAKWPVTYKRLEMVCAEFARDDWCGSDVFKAQFRHAGPWGFKMTMDSPAILGIKRGVKPNAISEGRKRQKLANANGTSTPLPTPSHGGMNGAVQAAAAMKEDIGGLLSGLVH